MLANAVKGARARDDEVVSDATEPARHRRNGSQPTMLVGVDLRSWVEAH